MSVLKSTNGDMDSFRKMFMENIKKEPLNVVLVPKLQGNPNVSVGALPDLPYTNWPAVTWRQERGAQPNQLPDESLYTGTLKQLLPEDNFEQLEKYYKYERAKAELEECYQLRLVAAKEELERWKHVTEQIAVDLAAAKESSDGTAVAMHDATLDRAQGRIIHWGPIVEKARVEVQRCKAEILRWERPAVVARNLLSQKHTIDARWLLVTYIIIRKHSSVSEDKQRKSVGR